MRQESMKESTEIDMDSKIDNLMKLLKEAGALANELTSEGIPIKLIAILGEKPGGADRNEEVQGSIDAVICALSKDIVDTITGKKGFPCDGKEVVEKTQALASLVEASTRACRTKC